MIEWVLLGVGFLGLFIGTLTDFHRREVPDWINYAMIISGLGINFIRSVSSGDWWHFVLSVIGFAIGFGFGVIMFFTGQWGGGDTKALGGLGALFGSYAMPAVGLLQIETYEWLIGPFAGYNVLFFPILISNILVAGAIYGVIWTIIISVKHWKNIIAQYKKESAKLHTFRIISYSVALLFIILGIVVFETAFRTGMFLFAFLSIFLLILHAYIKALEAVAMTSDVPITKPYLEGEWIVKDVLVDAKPDSFGKMVSDRIASELESYPDIIDGVLRFFGQDERADRRQKFKVEKYVGKLPDKIVKAYFAKHKGNKSYEMYEAVTKEVAYLFSHKPKQNRLSQQLAEIICDMYPYNFEKIYVCGPKVGGITKYDIALLHKHKVKQVRIKIGIPFIPAFLIGFLYTIFFGSVIELALLLL